MRHQWRRTTTTNTDGMVSTPRCSNACNTTYSVHGSLAYVRPACTICIYIFIYISYKRVIDHGIDHRPPTTVLYSYPVIRRAGHGCSDRGRYVHIPDDVSVSSVFRSPRIELSAACRWSAGAMKVGRCCNYFRSRCCLRSFGPHALYVYIYLYI